MAVYPTADIRNKLPYSVSVRHSYKHMLMAMDTCEYFTIGPLSHTHIHIYLSSKLPKSHLRRSEWAYVVKVGGFPCDCSLWIILCESSPCVCTLSLSLSHTHIHTHTYTHTHTIPPADCRWRPPGHNQSGPGVKIIVSLVGWKRLTEGLARQEGGLGWT